MTKEGSCILATSTKKNPILVMLLPNYYKSKRPLPNKIQLDELALDLVEIERINF